MEISTKEIKALRDATGVSVMQCKKALEEAGGDLEKAKIILQKVSKDSVVKKAERNLGAGVVVSYIHTGGSKGSMLELLCETDFVARNEEFKNLGKEIAMHITAMDPENTEELLSQEFIKAPEKLIRNLIEEAVQKFGEKTEIGKFVRFSIN